MSKTVQKGAWTLALTMILVSITASLAQTSSPPAKKLDLHQHPVTLETILSCAADPLLKEVFKTDRNTTFTKLDAGLMIEMKSKNPGTDYIELKSKGFVTRVIDDSTLQIIPTDAHSGTPISSVNLPFCHDSLSAHYENSGDEAKPTFIYIGGDGWLLNPNEIWAHANQFHFDSGVLTNNSDVFFAATKGRVSIDFLSKPNGLKFYRAMYLAPDL
ncbi:MAG TPA: hypothetical protein VN670_07120 [Acidobacteriaceae bacterium]|nr:hypothetical protein [Acidobacteriaceae bacterium]